MRQQVAQLGACSQGLVTAAALLSAGVSRSSLSRAVARGEVLRIAPRVYALSALPTLPRFVVTDEGVSPLYVAWVRAVLLQMGSRAAAGGRSAAALYGWGLFVEPRRTVEVAVPHGRSSGLPPRVRSTQRRSASTQLCRLLPGTAPLRITTPVQTVLDCALGLPLLEAVVVCDSALRSGRVAVEELVAAVARLPGVRAATQARRVIELCDPLSGSVLESVLRVRMAMAGISGWRSQLLIRDPPGQQLRVDFCFERQALVVEVDGQRWHQDPARDQARDNALAALGWRVLRFTWAQVVHEPEQVLEQLQSALACASPRFHLAAEAVEEAA